MSAVEYAKGGVIPGPGSRMTSLPIGEHLVMRDGAILRWNGSRFTHCNGCEFHDDHSTALWMRGEIK